jgi:hypothetical protein
MSPLSATRLALDGSTVHIRSAMQFVDNYTSVGAIDVGLPRRRWQEFIAAPLDFGEEFALSPETGEGMAFDEEYSLQGGRLRLAWGREHVGPDGAEYWERGPDGRGRPKPLRIGVWQGQAFSLTTVIRGDTSSDLLAIFEAIVITESALGVAVSTRNPRRHTFVDGPSILQDVPQLGLLDIADVSDPAVRALPRRKRGTPVVGGELFVEERGEPMMSFMLVGETSRTYIIPHPGIAEQQLVDGSSNLEVAWSAGP